MKIILRLLALTIALSCGLSADAASPLRGSAPQLNSNSVAFFARLATQPSAANQIYYNRLVSWLTATGTWAKLDGLYLFEAQDQATANTNLISSSWTITPTGSPTFTAFSGYVGTTGGSPNATLFPKSGASYFDPSVTTNLCNASGGYACSVFFSRSAVSANDNTSGAGYFGLSAHTGGNVDATQTSTGYSTAMYSNQNDRSGFNYFGLSNGVIGLSSNGASGSVNYVASVNSYTVSNAAIAVGSSNLGFLNDGTNNHGSTSIMNAAGMGGALSRWDFTNLAFAVQNYHYDVTGADCSTTRNADDPASPCLRFGKMSSIYPYNNSPNNLYDYGGISRLKDGRLISILSVGSFACNASNSNQGIYYQLSSDNGNTWTTAPGTLIMAGVTSGTTPSGATLWVTGLPTVLDDGSIIIAVYYLQWSSTTCAGATDVYDIGSIKGTVATDGTITWGAINYISANFTGGNVWKDASASSSGILQLPNGTLMFPIYGNANNVGASFSSDRGTTWGDAITIVQSPTNHYYEEPACVNLPSGSAYCVLRDEGLGPPYYGWNDNPYRGYVAISSATPTVAASWSTAFQILDWTEVGWPSVAALAADPQGHMMFVYRQPVSAGVPQTYCDNSGVTYSIDGAGATWSHPIPYQCQVTNNEVSTPAAETGGYSYCFYDAGFTNTFLCQIGQGANNGGPTEGIFQQFFFQQ